MSDAAIQNTNAVAPVSQDHGLYERAIRFVWRCLPYVSQRIATSRSDNNESQVEALVQLFFFFVTTLATGILVEQDRGIRPSFILIYAVIGFVILGTMCAIVASIEGDGKTKGVAVYAHNIGTTRIGKWLIPCTIILLIVFIGLAVFGALPGQSVDDVRIISVENNMLEDGLPGLTLGTRVQPAHFGGRVPAAFKISAKLVGQTLKDHWKLVSPNAYIVAVDRHLIDLPKAPGQIEKSWSDNVDAIIDTTDSQSDYFVEFDLRPDSPKVDEFEALDSSDPEQKLKKDELLKVLTEEFAALREQARQQILFQGGAALNIEQ